MQNNQPDDPKEKAKLQMKKKTNEELSVMASKKTTSTESVEDPMPLGHRPSESSLDQLNQEINKVPLVRAFNSVEKHLDQKKK